MPISVCPIRCKDWTKKTHPLLNELFREVSGWGQKAEAYCGMMRSCGAGGMPIVSCFWRTSRSVTNLARSSGRLRSTPAVCRTRPQQRSFPARSYSSFSRSFTVHTVSGPSMHVFHSRPLCNTVPVRICNCTLHVIVVYGVL